MIPSKTASILIKGRCSCIHPESATRSISNSRSYSQLDRKWQTSRLTRAGKRRNSSHDRNANCENLGWMDEEDDVLLPPPSDFSVQQMFQEHRPLAIGSHGSHRWMYDVERQLRDDNAKLANVNTTHRIASNTFSTASLSNRAGAPPSPTVALESSKCFSAGASGRHADADKNGCHGR